MSYRTHRDQDPCRRANARSSERGLASFVVPSQRVKKIMENRALSPLLFYRFGNNAGKFGSQLCWFGNLP